MFSVIILISALVAGYSADQITSQQACDVLMAQLTKTATAYGAQNAAQLIAQKISHASFWNAANEDLLKFKEPACKAIEEAAATPNTTLGDLKPKLTEIWNNIDNAKQLKKRTITAPQIKFPQKPLKFRMLYPSDSTFSPDQRQMIARITKDLDPEDVKELLRESKDLQSLAQKASKLSEGTPASNPNEFKKFHGLLQERIRIFKEMDDMVNKFKLNDQNKAILNKLASHESSKIWKSFVGFLKTLDEPQKGRLLEDIATDYEDLAKLRKQVGPISEEDFRKYVDSRGFKMTEDQAMKYMILLKQAQTKVPQPGAKKSGVAAKGTKEVATQTKNFAPKPEFIPEFPSDSTFSPDQKQMIARIIKDLEPEDGKELLRESKDLQSLAQKASKLSEGTPASNPNEFKKFHGLLQERIRIFKEMDDMVNKFQLEDKSKAILSKLATAESSRVWKTLHEILKKLDEPQKGHLLKDIATDYENSAQLLKQVGPMSKEDFQKFANSQDWKLTKVQTIEYLNMLKQVQSKPKKKLQQGAKDSEAAKGTREAATQTEAAAKGFWRSKKGIILATTLGSLAFVGTVLTATLVPLSGA